MKITSLNLANNGISHEGLRLLSEGNCCRLVELTLGNLLNIIDSNPIGDEGVEYLNAFWPLQKVSLRDTKITEKGLEVLVQKAEKSEEEEEGMELILKSLKWLNVRDNMIKMNTEIIEVLIRLIGPKQFLRD